jgi:exosortase/archaeosortase family protein
MNLPSFRSVSPLARFGLLAGGGYLLWFWGYEHYLAPDGRLDAALTHNLAQVSAAGLRGLGFAATVSAGPRPVISLAQLPAVGIWHPCNGLVLYALFAGFILAFPGPGRAKRWFVPLGLGLIYSLNVGRVVLLCLNVHYAQRSASFNHHYTFTCLVYAAIFGLWMWWAAHLAPPRRAAAPNGGRA